jgi:hypothetical protein
MPKHKTWKSKKRTQNIWRNLHGNLLNYITDEFHPCAWTYGHSWMNFIHDVNDDANNDVGNDARCDVGHVIHDTFLCFDILPCQMIILESSHYFLHMYVII